MKGFFAFVVVFILVSVMIASCTVNSSSSRYIKGSDPFETMTKRELREYLEWEIKQAQEADDASLAFD